jgi:hypothetical protein
MSAEKKIRNRWLDAISSMIELTQDGKLKWSAAATPGGIADDTERTSSVFQTSYNGKSLRLYEKRVPAKQGGFPASIYALTGEEPPKWYKRVLLEFVGADGHSLWTFPDVDALSDLLTSVQYQVVGVHDFLDEIISEARNTPKHDPANALKESVDKFNERGQALSRIVQIANNDGMSEKERLDQIRSLAFKTIAKPTF